MTGARVLLLAAGRGKRAGGPKAWRDFGGKSLLQAHLDFFVPLVGAAGISVAIQKEWMEKCRKMSPETVWVEADPEATPMDSLQRLISSSPSVRSFVLHVDMPVFQRTTFELMWNVPGEAVVPVFEGRRGHPVLLSPSALNEIKRLDSMTGRLDLFLRTFNVIDVAVQTPSILQNLNEATA